MDPSSSNPCCSRVNCRSCVGRKRLKKSFNLNNLPLISCDFEKVSSYYQIKYVFLFRITLSGNANKYSAMFQIQYHSADVHVILKILITWMHDNQKSKGCKDSSSCENSEKVKIIEPNITFNQNWWVLIICVFISIVYFL